MPVMTAVSQDMPRIDERGASHPEQVAVAWMCYEFGYGPSKASRLVRKFIRARDFGRDRVGWSDADFESFLLTEAIVTRRNVAQLMASWLRYADPTGDQAVRNVLREDGDGSRARFLADRRYEVERLQRQRAYVGAVPSLPGGPAYGRAERFAGVQVGAA